MYEVNTAFGQVAELIDIIAAVNDARLHERRGFRWHIATYPAPRHGVNEDK